MNWSERLKGLFQSAIRKARAYFNNESKLPKSPIPTHPIPRFPCPFYEMVVDEFPNGSCILSDDDRPQTCALAMPSVGCHYARNNKNPNWRNCQTCFDTLLEIMDEMRVRVFTQEFQPTGYKIETVSISLLEWLSYVTSDNCPRPKPVNQPTKNAIPA